MKTIRLNQNGVVLNGQVVPTRERGGQLLVELQRAYCPDYAKFFKMSLLARLAFIASEMLLRSEQPRHPEGLSDRAVVFLNASSSLHDDRLFAQSCADIPSPALFVYTLPNIAVAEVAIRHKLLGETSFFVLPKFDAEAILALVRQTFADAATQSALVGWTECASPADFEARLALVEREEALSPDFKLL